MEEKRMAEKMPRNWAEGEFGGGASYRTAGSAARDSRSSNRRRAAALVLIVDRTSSKFQWCCYKLSPEDNVGL